MSCNCCTVLQVPIVRAKTKLKPTVKLCKVKYSTQNHDRFAPFCTTQHHPVPSSSLHYRLPGSVLIIYNSHFYHCQRTPSMSNEQQCMLRSFTLNTRSVYNNHFTSHNAILCMATVHGYFTYNLYLFTYLRCSSPTSISLA